MVGGSSYRIFVFVVGVILFVGGVFEGVYGEGFFVDLFGEVFVDFENII